MHGLYVMEMSLIFVRGILMVISMRMGLMRSSSRLILEGVPLTDHVLPLPPQYPLRWDVLARCHP